MYIVKDSAGEIVAIATRKEDAEAMASGGSVDKKTYTVEKE